jgi:hypothetical protein
MDQSTSSELTAAPAALPSLSFVERVLARHKGLNRTQLVICEEFIRFPSASREELATAAGCDKRTVARWMSDPEFWAVVGEFDLGKVQRQQALALLSAKLSDLLSKASGLTAEDGAWLDRAARWTGITREVPAAVAFAQASAGSSDLSARISARAAELARDVQAELGLDSPLERVADVSGSGEKRVEHSTSGADVVPAGGGQ